MVGFHEFVKRLCGIATSSFLLPISVHFPSLIEHDHHFKAGIPKNNVRWITLWANEFMWCEVHAEATEKGSARPSLPLSLPMGGQHIHCVVGFIRQLSQVVPFIHP